MTKFYQFLALASIMLVFGCSEESEPSDLVLEKKESVVNTSAFMHYDINNSTNQSFFARLIFLPKFTQNLPTNPLDLRAGEKFMQTLMDIKPFSNFNTFGTGGSTIPNPVNDLVFNEFHELDRISSLKKVMTPTDFNFTQKYPTHTPYEINLFHKVYFIELTLLGTGEKKLLSVDDPAPYPSTTSLYGLNYSGTDSFTGYTFNCLYHIQTATSPVLYNGVFTIFRENRFFNTSANSTQQFVSTGTPIRATYVKDISAGVYRLQITY